MSIFHSEVEEYIFLNPYMQGNINVAGLIFDDLLTEQLSVTCPVWIVWVEEISESLEIETSFTPEHHCFLEDSYNFEDIKLGLPVRLGNMRVDVAHTPDVYPLACCFMQVDILHGIDTFYEENIERMDFIDDGHFSEVYFPYCYESLDIKMENVSEFKIYACYKVIKMATSDHLNMRHSVVQEYYFNSKAFDYFFAYDKYAWGWDKYLADNFDITLWLKGAYGKSIHESLTAKLGLLATWTGQQELSERFMAYDQAIFEKFYAKVVEESLGLAVSMDVDSRMMHTAIESLALGETPILEVQRFLQAVESLAITQAASVIFGHCPEVVESLDLANSPELLRAIPQVLVDVAKLLDDPVSKWLALCLLQETINDSDKAIR
jgi:hypothetical protein